MSTQADIDNAGVMGTVKGNLQFARLLFGLSFACPSISIALLLDDFLLQTATFKVCMNADHWCVTAVDERSTARTNLLNEGRDRELPEECHCDLTAEHQHEVH